MDASLRQENGWLALAGLHWLQDGANTFGAKAGNDIILPGEKTPDFVGVFEHTGNAIALQVKAGTPLKVNGDSVNQFALLPDTNDSPSIITMGSLQMVIIQRGELYGLRVWDNNRPERQSFPGRRWYPLQLEYRLQADFEPYERPRNTWVASISGGDQEVAAVGQVGFSLHGKRVQLEAFEGPAGGLFVIFKDLTSGKDSYPAGRYLTSAKPEEDHSVVLDFNRAYNPPCAFTDYATCALPPPQNRLSTHVEAGEQYFTWR